MNEKNNCLICCRPLDSSDDRYHPQCSQRLFNQRTAPVLPYGYDDLKEAAKKVIRNRIAVPGVQAKLSLNLEKIRNKNSRFTLVGLWGNFILKPPVKIYPNIPEVEHLTMNLASLFKIHTVPHGLIHLKSGELAYITRRIDRSPRGEKLHMEDMCQLSERLTEDKYHGSMEQIGKILKRYSSNPLFDCIRFFDVALFSFLMGNADMHLKNFSLIYPVDGMVQLSVAYDMLATRLLISEKDDPEEMALTVNGRKRKITLDDFSQLAANLGLSGKQIKNIFKRFSEALPSIRTVIDLGFLSDDKATEFNDLITDRATRLALL
jgi:serine/threonine-protein kinase HipA